MFSRVKLIFFLVSLLAINATSHSRHIIYHETKDIENPEEPSKSTVDYSLSTYFEPGVNAVKQFLDYGKQALIGIPQEFASNAKRFLCSKAAHLNDIQKEFHPEAGDFNYLFLTQDRDNVTVSLSDSERLFNHQKFHINWNVVLFVSGWDLNVTQSNNTIWAFYEAYRCRSGYNFVVLDTSKFVNSIYAWSEFSTAPSGELIADAIVNLTRYMPYENIHIIGHGIGAHIAGMAGRRFTALSGKAIPRITGIDPSRPCFSESDRANGLQRGDALFVDIIHSRNTLLTSDPIGDVDFYPNGLKIVQTGCWSITCSPVMAYEFFTETIYPGNEFLFNATECGSLGLLRMGNCRVVENKPSTIPLGIATPNWARGTFYLTTSFLRRQQKRHCND